MPPIPYCLNIHPGESLAAIREAIESHALAVKARVAPDAPYPLGLRLSAAAAGELAASPAALDAFAGLLARHDLFVTGINGFPYGAFHNTAVKTAVYTPDWSTPERQTYTGRLAAILAALLPEGRTGNISTVPLGYRGSSKVLKFESSKVEKARNCRSGSLPPETSDRPPAQVCARQLAVTALFLDTLLRETGREIVLALEPEPDCLLETTDDAVAWFEDEFLFEGVRWLSASKRRTRDAAEALLRRHIGLCLDTCHFAVAFEDPLTALVRFESACIRVACVQLSAAVRATVSDDSLNRLRAFIDPVYLHQTKIRLPRGRIASLPDLTETTLETARAHSGCELRTHFHVPLFWDGDDALGTTNIDLTPEFFAHVQAHGYPLETETYTFGVLPPALRAPDVVDNLVREHEWVQKKRGPEVCANPSPSIRQVSAPRACPADDRTAGVP
jgi:hypothetical protein